MSENIVHIKSRLTLLPEYAENKATLLKQHKEPSHEEVMERLTAKLTETIKFRKYGIEDGPDMELFDEEGSISSLIVPGDWMSEAHELPRIAAVDTPSVKYRPAAHEPIAVYAGYGNNPDATGFNFIAWFLVEEIELFAAGSLDLARRMHDKKWDADMGHEWYVIFKYFKTHFLLLLPSERGRDIHLPEHGLPSELAFQTNGNARHKSDILLGLLSGCSASREAIPSGALTPTRGAATSRRIPKRRRPRPRSPRRPTAAAMRARSNPVR
jgi:hypothetical protein